MTGTRSKAKYKNKRCSQEIRKVFRRFGQYPGMKTKICISYYNTIFQKLYGDSQTLSVRRLGIFILQVLALVIKPDRHQPLLPLLEEGRRRGLHSHSSQEEQGKV